MELSFKSNKSSILSQFQEIISPFLSQPQSDEHSQIMALNEVERTLHHHFVNKEPIWITYEYYDINNQLHLTEEIVFVESAINSQRQFHFSTLNSHLYFSLHTDQILSVSANIAA